MGTPELARTVLQALLIEPSFQIAAVVTQPDRPKGRDLKIQPSPVKGLAVKNSLPLLQPERARDPVFFSQLGDIKPDLIAVAAYGQILPQCILDLPAHGCLNVHTSLLPRYRGAAPIQWALLNDDPETGVTIMKMDAGMDTGEILTQEKTSIKATDTAESLHDRLAEIGGRLLVRTIPDFVAGKIIPCPQPSEGVVLAPKIKKKDGIIDWMRPARGIWNQVRALVPWPGAFTSLSVKGYAQLLKIWRSEIAPGSGNPGQILH